MINYINKDITTVETGVIVHGVNCQGAMGSGVALAILKKWPTVYSEYKKFPTGSQSLGKIQPIEIEPKQLYVINCFGSISIG